jgi:hypothetical protein
MILSMPIQLDLSSQTSYIHLWVCPKVKENTNRLPQAKLRKATEGRRKAGGVL